MIKGVFMLHSSDLPNDLPAFERWYTRYHAPEVISKDGPWLARFIGYRPLPVIPEALQYGYYNQRVTEAWFRSEDKRPTNIINFNRKPPWVKEAKEKIVKAIPDVSISVTEPPADVFLSGRFKADDKTILRWYTITKYPKGVSIADGEDWFLNIHSKEVLQQPGLIAYFSYRAVKIPEQSPGWVRLTELWYEDFRGWKKAVIESPPKYTKPPWAKYDKYPFLEPYVDFTSTFLMERPDHDYLKEVSTYP